MDNAVEAVGPDQLFVPVGVRARLLALHTIASVFKGGLYLIRSFIVFRNPRLGVALSSQK